MEIEIKPWGKETIFDRTEDAVSKLIELEDSTSVHLHTGKIESFVAITNCVIRYMTSGQIGKIINTLSIDEFTDYCSDILDQLDEIVLFPGDVLTLDKYDVHQIVGPAKLMEVGIGFDTTVYRLNDLNRDRELHIEEVYNALRMKKR